MRSFVENKCTQQNEKNEKKKRLFQKDWQCLNGFERFIFKKLNWVSMFIQNEQF